MIKEEKFELLNKLLEIEEKNDIGNLTRAERREFQQWINDVIEHEPILNKIRTEIDQLKTSDEYTGESILSVEFKDDVLNIIDYYRG